MAKIEKRRVKGFEDYSVDSNGTIYGRTGKPMKPHLSKGYSRVSLRSNGKYKIRRIHRLVWESFNGRIRGVINHKDFDRSNNRLSNLEDISVRENNLHWMKAKDEGYTSRITGIRLKKDGLFRARLMHNGKVYETDRNTEAKALEWYTAKTKELGISSKYLRR